MEQIISKETFAKFTPEEKAKIRRFIKGYSKTTDNAICDEINRGIGDILTEIFGKENICKNLYPPKCWEDVVELFPCSENGMDDVYDSIFYVGRGMLGDKVRKKIVATIKLSRILELGYSRFSYAQQKEDFNDRRFHIDRSAVDPKELTVYEDTTEGEPRKRFLSFRTRKDAEEFLAFESNRKLTEDYYMFGL